MVVTLQSQTFQLPMNRARRTSTRAATLTRGAAHSAHTARSAAELTCVCTQPAAKKDWISKRFVVLRRCAQFRNDRPVPFELAQAAGLRLLNVLPRCLTGHSTVNAIQSAAL